MASLSPGSGEGPHIIKRSGKIEMPHCSWLEVCNPAMVSNDTSTILGQGSVVIINKWTDENLGFLFGCL